MTRTSSNTSSLPDSLEMLSPSERRYIERYTKRMRKTGPESTSVSDTEPLWRRARHWIEGVNRRAIYRIFRFFFRNDELTKRLDPSHVRSIFVIPFGGAIGDMLVAIPLFHAIERHLPQCKVGTFVTERNRTLLSADSSVDEIFPMRDKRSFHNIREIMRARRSGYDVVINMHIHGMTEYGLIANALAPRGTKVSWTHERGKLYRTLYNKLIPYDRNSMQEAQMGLVMLESVIALERPVEQWESRPAVIIAEHTRALMEQKLDETLERLGASWYVHLNMQARNPRMEWGIENIVAFTERFVNHYQDGAILFSASPILRHSIELQLQKLGLPRAIFFPTSFDLHEIAMLVERSKLIITPDTAITHFASATERPVLVLHAGLVDLPIEWVALQIPSYILAPPLRYMKASTIPVEDVWNAMEKLLHGEWVATASTVGLQPEADPLFQATNATEPLSSLIARSSVPRFFALRKEASVEQLAIP